MSKLVDIEATLWLDQFSQQAGANYVLGKFLLEQVRLADGWLGVWLPEGYEHLPNQNLSQDLFDTEETFPLWEDVCSFLDNALNSDPSRLLLSGTYRNLIEPNLRPLPVIPWFTLIDENEKVSKVCVYLPGHSASPKAYDEVFAEASTRSQVVIITSLPLSQSLFAGQKVDATSELFKLLFSNIDHILLGVFDERSYMVWSRYPKLLPTL